MTGSDEEHKSCPPETLKLLGDYMTLRIIDMLGDSGLRFSELLRSIHDTNSMTLTNRLKRMSDAGLIQRSEATVDRKSVIYELSDHGKQLLPVLDEIKKFAAQHSSGKNEPA